MHDDDSPLGRLLTRREMVALLGASSAALLLPSDWRRHARTPSPGCVVRPEQEEGPYFVDEGLLRSDIRTDPVTGTPSLGIPLALTFALSRISGGSCAPLVGAQVDVWHCDAHGMYSDAQDTGFDTRGQRYLRGYQLTNARGLVTFQTIYPGWYPERAIHIHLKVRTTPSSPRGFAFTSQVYFDDALTDRVHANKVYATRPGTRLRNAEDELYPNGGEQLMLDVEPSGSGFKSLFPIGLQLP